MKRRQFIKQVSTGIAGLSILPLCSCSKQPKKPNIIVFLVDDMGVMDTSVPFMVDAAGKPKKYPLNDFYRTPNMEKLAEQGIRFSDFYAQSVCSPTRASIMTGQNAARHHTTTWIRPDHNNRGEFGPPEWNWEGLKKNDVTLPRLLQKEGYRTIHVGKAHFGPMDHDGADPLKLGFTKNIGGACWGRPRSYYGEDHYGNHPKYGDNRHHAIPHLEKYHGTDTYLTEALTLEANREIKESVNANQPFFLNMAHYTVHAPFMSDPRFADHYQSSNQSSHVKNFATMIEGMDKSLGDIMTQIGKLRIADNTLIFFLGDNGTDAPLGGPYEIACATPLRGKKGSHYEGGIRVPFMAAWGKQNANNYWQKQLPISAGKIQSQLGTIMDIFPTITNLIGAAIPKAHNIDGYNLKKQLSGNRNPNRENRFMIHFPHGVHRSNYFTGLRTGNWKVIYHYYPEMNQLDSHYQLFNLKDDPSESHNLATERPDQLKIMMHAMLDEMKNQNAQFPIDEQGNALKPKVEEL